MSGFYDSYKRELVGAAGALFGEPVVAARRPLFRRRPVSARVRVGIVVLAMLCASAGIALAATGVILTGSPVRPSGPLSAGVGEGVPKPGHARLLSLRVADPEGGLPWGMRVVATTRGLVCLQVGRVRGSELGELGIDGAFHDDGRFHPLSANVLPRDAVIGLSGNASCHLAGQAFTGESTGIDRNATPQDEGRAPAKRRARSGLRDVSYGSLGGDAVSVWYRVEGEQREVPVVGGIGAYLIVRRSGGKERFGISSGGGSGRVYPSGGLTVIAYRFKGGVCESSVVVRVADPCPRVPVQAHRLRPTKILHVPLHVGVSRRGSGDAWVSFRAPYAVRSARQDYVFAIPAGACHGIGTTEISLGHDVARGETVVKKIDAIYGNACGERKAQVRVLYREGEGTGEVLVGQVTITQPPPGSGSRGR